MRGCCNEKLGHIDKGIQDFSLVLDIDPSHINAAYAKGAAENKRGNFAQAIEDYNMALEKDLERERRSDWGLGGGSLQYGSQPSNSRKYQAQNVNMILNASQEPQNNPQVNSRRLTQQYPQQVFEISTAQNSEKLSRRDSGSGNKQKSHDEGFKRMLNLNLPDTPDITQYKNTRNNGR